MILTLLIILFLHITTGSKPQEKSRKTVHKQKLNTKTKIAIKALCNTSLNIKIILYLRYKNNLIWVVRF